MNPETLNEIDVHILRQVLGAVVARDNIEFWSDEAERLLRRLPDEREDTWV